MPAPPRSSRRQRPICIEPQFYSELIGLVGLSGEALPGQMDRDTWPSMKERFASIFATKTRAEWVTIFEGSDACAAPVLSSAEAHLHPHNVHRNTFTEVAGVVQPAPSPRFEGTPEALDDWGVDAGDITKLRESGAIR